MKSTKKEKSSDFTLLSQQTKKRIAGLIEMKLTPQTIALFAQEYEDYDPEIRLEIVEYIGFLMEQEMTMFMHQVRTTVPDENTVRRRQMEFEEKARNIRKIQDILIEPKSAFRPAKKSQPKEQNTVRESLAKVSKSQAENKIDKMIKEAEERERKNRKLEAEAEARRQKELKEAAKQKEKAQKAAKVKPAKAEKAPKSEKATKEVSKVDADAARAAKEKAANEEFLRRQKELQQDKERQAKEYARREAEKEKLWMELYGKSRTESQKQRDIAEEQHKAKPEEERDKTPKIRDQKITSYQLFGHTYEAEELTDPKNRVYLFWFNTRQKQNVGNLFSWIESLPLNKQKKLFKKRLKWMKKIAKISATANATAEKEERERVAAEAAAKAEADKQAQAAADKAAKDKADADAQKAKDAAEAEKAKAKADAEKAKAKAASATDKAKEEK